MKDHRSIPLDAFPWEKEEGARLCDHQGCAGEGLYQAPCAPDNMETFYWFCLDHVRPYNKAWNFFAHASPAEIEIYNRGDTVGWRPSWPLGERMVHMEAAWSRFFDSFSGDADSQGYKGGNSLSNLHWANAIQGKALNLFNLQSPLTLGQLKARYKELVKRYHPDANGGDKKLEERLKQVNEAYGVLKSFICAP